MLNFLYLVKILIRCQGMVSSLVRTRVRRRRNDRWRRYVSSSTFVSSLKRAARSTSRYSDLIKVPRSSLHCWWVPRWITLLCFTGPPFTLLCFVLFPLHLVLIRLLVQPPARRGVATSSHKHSPGSRPDTQLGTNVGVGGARRNTVKCRGRSPS